MSTLDTIVEFLKGRFGETKVMRWGIVASIILAIVLIYAFFIKELTSAYDKYYAFKLEKCKDAALATAQIANSTNETKLREALARFDELYYGDLVLFEGKDLERAMIDFRKLFGPNDARVAYNGDISYENLRSTRDANAAALRRAALSVSDACQLEVRPSWFSGILERLDRTRLKYGEKP